MKNIFLTSSFSDVVDLFVEHEKENIKGKTVTFIPTASLPEEVTFYVEAGKEALEGLGLMVDVLEISTAKHDEITRKINNNDYIYITGGNTFFLLQELKRSGADKLIIEQINAGKTYIGESAGSIVLAPNIEYVTEMDDVSAAPDIESYDALNVIDFYPVPHYADFPFEEVSEVIVSKYKETLNICPFSNHQMIFVEGDNVRIKG